MKRIGMKNSLQRAATLVAGVICLGSSALACPELAGTFEFPGSNQGHFIVSQDAKDGVNTYETLAVAWGWRDQMIADGRQHSMNKPPLKSYIAKCEGDQLIMTAEGESQNKAVVHTTTYQLDADQNLVVLQEIQVNGVPLPAPGVTKRATPVTLKRVSN